MVSTTITEFLSVVSSNLSCFYTTSRKQAIAFKMDDEDGHVVGA